MREEESSRNPLDEETRPLNPPETAVPLSAEASSFEETLSSRETSAAAATGAAEKPALQEEPALQTEEPPQEVSAATGESTADDAELLDALRQVVDPELMINIVDLGLIYEIQREGKTVHVAMTLTSPACPAGPQIMQQSKLALERLESVDEARIRLVMSPPWSPDRMTDEARDQLGIF